MSDDEKFKKGDVVMLKSGGPKMTVTGYEEDGSVSCEWFDNNERKNAAFEEDTLKPVENVITRSTLI